MITFTPVCLRNHRNKDGSYPVKIRVYLNGQSRWLPTNIAAYPSDLTRALKLKPSLPLTQANELIKQMRQAVGELNPTTIAQMTVEQAVDYIRREQGQFRLSFFDFAEEFIKTKREGTATCYRYAVKSLQRFIGGGDMDINDIRTPLLRDYLSQDLPTVNKYYILLGSIFKAARLKYNDEDSGLIRIPRNPFALVKPQRICHNGQHSLDASVIQAMIDYGGDSRYRRFALDLWLLSFALFGMNIADLYECAPPRNGWLTYERKKTRTRREDKALMKVRVPEQVLPIVERLSSGARAGRWLSLSRRYTDEHSLTSCINRHYKEYANDCGLEAFTFYSARKSFATLARRAGIDKATIDECLCHIGDYKLADIYIDKDFELLTIVQDKVLDFFKWDIHYLTE